VADGVGEVVGDVPRRVLAVYAHPDDHHVACGGTLARWAAAGAEVHVLLATRGEKGSADPAQDPDDLARLRADEVAAGAAALGVAAVVQLGHDDGELENTSALRGEVVAAIRRVRPDVVVGADPTAVFFGDGYVNHHDHRSLGWATFAALAPMAASPLYFPAAGPPHQVATAYLSGTLAPDVWVDVEEALDAKVDGLLCHRSQLAGGGEWLREFLRQRAEQAGAAAGLAYAEAFRRLRLAPPR
jgi:LmbE family N-acetylglucosaminyl deacetylase